MGQRRKTGDCARLPAISRRAVIGGGATATALCGTVLPVFHEMTNDTVAQCATWIALDQEIDRLSLRWSQIETALVAEFPWFQLSQAQRRALPQAAELFQIDERLEVLFHQRRRDLKALAKLKAQTPHAVASMLAVAARVLLYDESPAQPFITTAVRELAGMACEKCGEPLLPGRPISGVW
jgi:hypothetical protein